MTKAAEKVLSILYDKYKEAGKPRPFFLRTPELESEEGFDHAELAALLRELQSGGYVQLKVRQVILDPKGIEYCEGKMRRIAETVLGVIDKVKP